MEAVTNAERARWQGFGAHLVAEFIALGGKNDLPTLAWSVDRIGDVRGEVPESEEDPAAVFEQWCKLLGAGEPNSYVDTSRPVARTVSLAWAHVQGNSPRILLTVAVPVAT